MMGFILGFMGLIALILIMGKLATTMDNIVTPNECLKCGGKCERTGESIDDGWVCTDCGSYFDMLPLGPPL